MAMATQIDATTHAIAGAGGSVFALALLYPLDTLRLKLQGYMLF